MIARATARVARTIHGDVEHWQLGIVRATLAVALAALAMIALEVQLYSSMLCASCSFSSRPGNDRPGSPIVFLAIIHKP